MTTESAESEQPVVDVACAGIEPHDVVDTIVVEVPEADRRPACRMRAEIDAARPLPVLHQPDIDRIGGWIVPDDIAGAVFVEVGRPERLPTGRMCTGIDAAGPLAVGKLPDIEITVRGI